MLLLSDPKNETIFRSLIQDTIEHTGEERTLPAQKADQILANILRSDEKTGFNQGMDALRRGCYPGGSRGRVLPAAIPRTSTGEPTSSSKGFATSDHIARNR